MSEHPQSPNRSPMTLYLYHTISPLSECMESVESDGGVVLRIDLFRLGPGCKLLGQ